MKKQIENRLKDLEKEYEKGQEKINTLDQEMTNLRASMLRISGAIQVLQEIQEASGASLVEKEIVDNGVKQT